MRWAKHKVKQLDCTTKIASSQSYGIDVIHLHLYMTSNRLKNFGSKQKPRVINIWSVDWKTSKLNQSNEQMPCNSSSPKLIFGSAKIVWLKIIHISLEHYIMGIFSSVNGVFWHISHFRCTSIFKPMCVDAWMVAELLVRWTWTSGGIHSIHFLLECWLCQLFLHLTRLTWPIFQPITMLDHCFSQLELLEKIFAALLPSSFGYLSYWSVVSRNVPYTLTRHGIPQLELSCPHWEILT